MQRIHISLIFYSCQREIRVLGQGGVGDKEKGKSQFGDMRMSGK